MSVALKFVWNALVASAPEEAFVDLITALEAILLTRPDEIAHTLAERVAVLLDSQSQRGIPTYQVVKECYKTRSKIVHGRVTAKKGPQTGATLFVTARRSNVPLPAITMLVDIVVAVINKVFDEPELLGIIQARQSESQANRAIDDFFLRKLVSRRS